MKRIVYLLLMVTFSVLCLVSCGEKTSVNTGGENIDDIPVTPDNPTGNRDIEFKVSITIKGQTVPISESDGIYAIWVNRSEEVRALVKNGVASTKGLDGEYNVHLSKCIEGYTYDPNSAVATSNNSNTTIELMEISPCRGKGTNIYQNVYQIKNITIKDPNNVGELYAYSATVNKYVDKPDESGTNQTGTVFFQFVPNSPGIYTIESMVDTNDDNINPIVDIYNGTTAAKFFKESKDDGGFSKKGGYTKNFKYEVNISEEEIGNAYAFGIRAKVKNNVYPVDIFFKIVYISYYEMEQTDIELVLANEAYYKRDSDGKLIYPIDENGKLLNSSDEALAYNYVKIGDTVSGSIIDAYHTLSYGCVDNGGNLLHGVGGTNALISGMTENLSDTKYLRVRYSKVGDSYVRDPNGEYVRLGTINTKNHSGTYNDFVKYNGFKQGNRVVLDGSRVYFNKEDGYYHFDSLTGPIVCARITSKAQYFDSAFIHLEDPGNAVLRVFGKENYKRFVEAEYADMCNSDGVCYVTKELKDFLQKLSNSSSYFFDGAGWCEQDNTFASEDNQWLFACGFYE